jgi:hypothetical protein
MDLKKKLVSIAIALIFVLFVGYGIEVFDPTPDYNDVFSRNLYAASSQEECETAGGTWNEVQAEAPKPADGFCQESTVNRDKYDAMRDSHDRIVFIVAAVVGILAIIAGIMLKTEAVNSGILAGGILLVLYGTIRYWSHANNILKFFLLGAVLAVLLWIGYKKLK